MTPDFPAMAAELDTSKMATFLRTFPEDLKRGFTIASARMDEWGSEEPTGLLCLGMGGSGAGGDHLAALAEQIGNIPVIALRHDVIPAWWTPQWLTIATSHSGSTSETLRAVRDVVNKGGPLIALASGGELLELASNEKNAIAIKVEGERPPRTAFGELFGALIAISSAIGAIHTIKKERIEEIVEWLKLEVDSHDLAKSENIPLSEMVQTIAAAPLALLAPHSLGPMARRLRAQLNENGGVFARESILSEAHHNEIVAWESSLEVARNHAVIVIDTEDIEGEMLRRIDWTINELIQSPCIWRLRCEGDDLLTQLLHGCVMSDWLSYGVALMRGKDPTDIGPITRLKAYLST